MSFETDFFTLKRISEELQNPELPLDDLVVLLREATAAYTSCKSHLEAAQEALAALENAEE
ncbi:exodeoxyribonuclease VII small subunit [Deinococcus roseus]|uniref:Exodeoxyribonuclease VII small subunit n=1 Tax=Deinococcus roseus TaxID=392414 RepID=A0ABQ2D088_9DEIO|nr:exodeoxyribonuclease VII small subunit [Deinococcus roseus]GGJ38145.1 hypothetical protein GCM10008938_25340 [Deinococcus roseus]